MSNKSGEGKSPWGLGLVWIAGWLFTIGFLNMGFRDGLIGLLFWPYQIGKAMAGF